MTQVKPKYKLIELGAFVEFAVVRDWCSNCDHPDVQDCVRIHERPVCRECVKQAKISLAL